MLSKRHNILIVPFQISEFVYQNRLTKPFSIFLYLKLFAGDKVSASDEVFDKLRTALNMADCKNRTFRKHLQKLLDLNWIGFNPKSGIYHIRSFDHIRAVNDFKSRRGTKVFLKDILQMQIYLVGVLICNKINDQIYHWEKIKRRPRTAAVNRDAANQSKAFVHPTQPKYFGLSNLKLAALLGCSYTRACVLKMEAAAAGYLNSSHRYLDIVILTEADYNLRPSLSTYNPAFAKRLKFWPQITKDGKRIVKVVQQLHDQIVPLIEYKRLPAFSSLQVPFGIIRGFLKTNTTTKAA